MSKIGEIVRTHWYVFKDGIFSFHTAIKNDERIIFRSRHDTWPSIRAEAKGIKYDRMRNSHGSEIAFWLLEHPELEVLDRQEIKVVYE